MTSPAAAAADKADKNKSKDGAQPFAGVDLSKPTDYHLGPVLPHVYIAAQIIGQKFGIRQILGWRATAHDMLGHPAGRALDVMNSDTAKGNQILAFITANRQALSVNYVLWQQTEYSDEAGWTTGKKMEDRGSPTQNHQDHLHVNFSLLPSGLLKDGDLSILKWVGAGASVVTGAVGSAADALMPDWFGGVGDLALKLVGVTAAAALVIVGVKTAVTNKEG